MRAAIYQGLFFTVDANDTFAFSALAPRPICATGNCTYPEFETLAICPQCANTTDKLHRSFGGDSNSSSSAYRWSLPNGFSTGSIDMGSDNIVVMATSARYNAITLRAGLALLNFTAVHIPASYGGANGENYPIPTTAEECMPFWCVHKYSLVMVNGLLNETLLETTTEGANDIGSLYHFRPINSNASFEIPPEEVFPWLQPYPNGTVRGTFLVNKKASRLITDFFRDNFEGEVTALGTVNRDGHSTSPIT